MANGRYDQTPDDHRSDRYRADWRDDRPRAEGGRFRDEEPRQGRRGQDTYGRETEDRGRQDWSGWDRGGENRGRAWDQGDPAGMEGRDRGGEYRGRGTERGGYDTGPAGGQWSGQRQGQPWSGGQDSGGRDSSQGQPFRTGPSQRGKGPKGYTRADDRIREDVSDRLSDDDLLDASDITVSVKDCEVTLDGMVDSRAAKRAAEDCAEACSGVKHVQNNLRVRDASGADADRMSGDPASGRTKAKDR